MSTPTSVIKTDPVWSKNIYVLFNPDRLIEFFPNKQQTTEERMNAVARFSIYSCLLLVAYKRDWYYALGVPIMLLILNIIYSNEQSESFTPKSILKKTTPEQKRKPTLNNPMMNVSFADDTNAEAPDYYDDTEESQNIREDIKDKLDFNLYSSVDDVFERKNNQRQFYTVPSNDQSKFVNYLYKDMPESCKDNTRNCVPYEDVRVKTPSG